MTDFINMSENLEKDSTNPAEETADLDKVQQTAESSKPEEKVETTDDPTTNTGGTIPIPSSVSTNLSPVSLFLLLALQPANDRLPQAYCPS